MSKPLADAPLVWTLLLGMHAGLEDEGLATPDK